MVSEFMLQQTPVARVLIPWQAWLERWPTPSALAAAPAGEAVRAWGRLGYPRRALRLHRTATVLRDQYDGEVPKRVDDLLALPGVGHYTAAAIASFAFRQRHVVLDTNVRRVLARIEDGRAYPEPTQTVAERALAAEFLPRTSERAARVGGGLDGTRSVGLHGAQPALRRLPGRGTLPLASGGPPGVVRTATEGTELGRHRPTVSRRPVGRAAIQRRGRADSRAGSSLAGGHPTGPGARITAVRRAGPGASDRSVVPTRLTEAPPCGDSSTPEVD